MFDTFPELFSSRNLRYSIDSFVGTLIENYADAFERLSLPLLKLLLFVERACVDSPWFLVFAVICAFTYWSSRQIKITILVACMSLFIGIVGLWTEGMQTMALVLVSLMLTVFIGIPMGILMSYSSYLRAFMKPALDIMQTLPSFVYLIPVVMLFGLGKVPALIATVIYSLPPVIRLTNLGLQLVSKEVLEAAEAFGASRARKLFTIQLPLALPNIMAGINQTTMMALSMVVISSMIGARGLGQEVLTGINRLEVGRGLLSGFAIVALAIIFDRVTQSFATSNGKQKNHTSSH